MYRVRFAHSALQPLVTLVTLLAVFLATTGASALAIACARIQTSDAPKAVSCCEKERTTDEQSSQEQDDAPCMLGCCGGFAVATAESTRQIASAIVAATPSASPAVTITHAADGPFQPPRA